MLYVNFKQRAPTLEEALNSQVFRTDKRSVSPCQPSLCHQRPQCLNTGHNEQSDRNVRNGLVHGPNHIHSHLLRPFLPLLNDRQSSRETNSNPQIQHHPFRRPTATWWHTENIGLLPSWKRQQFTLNYCLLNLYIFYVSICLSWETSEAPLSIALQKI